MAWPTDAPPSDLNTTNLAAGSDSPALARPMLARAIIKLKAVIAARGAPNGIASLDGSGLVSFGQVAKRLWSPGTGSYQEIAGSTLITLTASIRPYTWAIFDIAPYWLGRTPGSGVWGDRMPVRAQENHMNASDIEYLRAHVTTTARDGSYFYIRAQRTSATSITLLPDDDQQGGTDTPKFRLYGIYGANI